MASRAGSLVFRGGDGDARLDAERLWPWRTAVIEWSRLRRKVFSYTEAGRGSQRPASEIDPATWMELYCRLEQPDGRVVEIDLLRGPDWIQDYGAHAGGTVFLNMPEMGVVGLAQVLRVEAR